MLGGCRDSSLRTADVLHCISSLPISEHRMKVDRMRTGMALRMGMDGVGMGWR